MKIKFRHTFYAIGLIFFALNPDLSRAMEEMDDDQMMTQGPLESLQLALERSFPTGYREKSRMGVSSTPARSGSELPGFPGSSNIYHIGATGFFLDHSGMLHLTSAQRKDLSSISEKSSRTQEDMDEKIKEAEEKLWKLTASDRPEMKLIEATVKEIETHRARSRLSFIRDVGEAASVLTPIQRDLLLGRTPYMSPAPSSGSGEDM